MTTWCPGNCDSLFLSEQKPPRSRWSRFWKVTFRRSETKWTTQQGCHSEEKVLHVWRSARSQVPWAQPLFSNPPPKNAYLTDILTTIKQTSNGETTACKSQGCGWSQGDVAFKNEQTPEWRMKHAWRRSSLLGTSFQDRSPCHAHLYVASEIMALLKSVLWRNCKGPWESHQIYPASIWALSGAADDTNVRKPATA